MSGWQRWHLPAPCRVNDPSHGTDNINSVHCRSHGSERAGRGASVAAQTRFMNVVEELRRRGRCDGGGRRGGEGERSHCEGGAKETLILAGERRRELGTGERAPHTGVRAAAGDRHGHEGTRRRPRRSSRKVTKAAGRVSKVTGTRIASGGRKQVTRKNNL